MKPRSSHRDFLKQTAGAGAGFWASGEKPKPFGERFAQFKGAVPGLPADLAEQHDHYRLGTPKRWSAV